MRNSICAFIAGEVQHLEDRQVQEVRRQEDHVSFPQPRSLFWSLRGEHPGHRALVVG